MDPSNTQKAHRYFAADAFNACWQLIDLPERSPEENREMIRRAETSYWHWMQVTDRTAENESVGLWQLARAYTLAGDAETAVAYAHDCLETTRKNDLGPFHEGYALEATARSYRALDMEKECQTALESAWSLTPRIADADSRELLEKDLRSMA